MLWQVCDKIIFKKLKKREFWILHSVILKFVKILVDYRQTTLWVFGLKSTLIGQETKAQREYIT